MYNWPVSACIQPARAKYWYAESNIAKTRISNALKLVEMTTNDVHPSRRLDADSLRSAHCLSRTVSTAGRPGSIRC